MKKQVLILSIVSLSTVFQADALATASSGREGMLHNTAVRSELGRDTAVRSELGRDTAVRSELRREGRLIVKPKPNSFDSIESILAMAKGDRRAFQTSSHEQDLYNLFTQLLGQQTTYDQLMTTFGFASGMALANASSYLTVAHQNELVGLQQQKFNSLSIEELSQTASEGAKYVLLNRLIAIQVSTKDNPIKGSPTIEDVWKQAQSAVKSLSPDHQGAVTALYNAARAVLASPDYVGTINGALMKYGYQAFPVDVQQQVLSAFKHLLNVYGDSEQALLIIQSSPNFGAAYESLTESQQAEINNMFGQANASLVNRVEAGAGYKALVKQITDSCAQIKNLFTSDAVTTLSESIQYDLLVELENQMSDLERAIWKTLNSQFAPQ